jgi:hypothetical protein
MINSSSINFRTIFFVGNKYSINMCFQSLEYVINSLTKQRIYCDQRIKWLKDLYLSLFYGRRSQGSTPIESILVIFFFLSFNQSYFYLF